MRPGNFDSLTRALATTQSRREAVRILAGAAAGAFLAFLGVGCGDDDPAGPAPPQDQCPTPSACGARQFCNAEETCLCVKSAEGYNRCGAIPTTCHVQLCQTSADCASLGEGFFCDTPNSGCCTDPPADLPRCLAPCGDVDNLPSTVCDGDPVTVASIEAAAAEIASGATQVDLSPGGCFRYTRTVANGIVLIEQVTANGQRVLRWDHAPTGSTGVRDSDLDGFTEWLSTVTRNAAGETQKVEVTEYDATTRSPAFRITKTVTGVNTMHVVVEQAADGGALEVVSEYDIARLDEPGTQAVGVQAAAAHVGDVHASVASAQATPGPCGVTPSPCPAGLADAARQVLKQVVADGSKCLAAHGLAAEAGELGKNFSRVDIVCSDTLPAASGPAAVCGPDTNNPNERFPIYINPSLWPSDAGAQRSIIFHEMLHTVLPEDHDPALNAAPPDIRRESDRVRACNSMCMNPNATKCDCAKCLKKSKCEPPCTSYKECALKEPGGLCQCPSRMQYYPKLSDCQAACPSGLSCFGFQCVEVSSPCMG